MKVRCRENAGTNLGSDYFRMGYFSTSRFDLMIGREYTVHSICLLKEGLLQYLIVGEGGDFPHWYPVELFELTDNQLPNEWHFSTWNLAVKAVWGYPEIVLSPQHFDELSDMDYRAYEVFRRRKEEAEGSS